MSSPRVSARLALGAGLLLCVPPLAAQTYRTNSVEPHAERRVRILQTNSAGDQVHVIDPRTNRVEGVIEGIPHNHGAVLHADGTYYYVTNEHERTLDVVDTRTLRVVKHIALAATPNNLSASDRARKVYVAISGAPLVQVIDMDSNEIVKNIPVPGGVHNTFVTPDGKFAVAGMIGAETMSVIDTSTDQVVWDLKFDGGVRPITFDTWPDGSTRRAFVQITGWHGFYVVDWEKRQVVDKISPPPVSVAKMVVDGTQSAPSHGAVVLPDQSQLWISSRATASIYGWSLPDLKFLGGIRVGNPAWLTAGADSRHIYVGISSHNETAVIDVKARREVARIPVGQVPKRIYTAVFPAGWNERSTEGTNGR